MAKSTNWIFKYVLAALVIGGLWIMSSQAPAPNQDAKTEVTHPTLVYTLPEAQQQQTKQLHATISADKEVVLSAYQQTKVSKVAVTTGNNVDKDSLLIQLDNTDADLEVQNIDSKIKELTAQSALKTKKIEQAKESYEQQQKMHQFTQARLTRFEKLYKSKAVSIQQLDEVRKLYEQEQKTLLDIQHMQESLVAESHILAANINQQQVLQKKALSARDKNTIRAPFNAKVAKLSVEEGDDVNNTQPLVTLLDTSTWDIKAFVPAKWVSSIQNNINNTNTLEAWIDTPQQKVKLKPDALSPDPQYPQLGQQLHFSLQDTSDRKFFYHKQALMVTISEPAPDNAFTIPPSALVLSKHIYIIDSNAIVRRIDVDVLSSGIVAQELWPLVYSPKLKPGMVVIADDIQSHLSNTKVTTTVEIGK